MEDKSLIGWTCQITIGKKKEEVGFQELDP